MFKKVISVLIEEGFFVFCFRVYKYIVRFIKVILNRFKIKFIKDIDESSFSKEGVNIIASFEYSYGIAEASRFLIKKLNECNIPFSLVNISNDSHTKISSDELGDFQKYCSKKLPYYKSFIFINGNRTRDFYQEYPENFKNHHNIGVWWWEFDNGLDDYISGFEYLNEVLVFSGFIKDALLKLPYNNCKISQMKFPLIQNWSILYDSKAQREKLGLKENDYIYMYSFDYFSGFDRKNPIAVIQAFAKILNGNKDMKLIMKTNNGHRTKSKSNLVNNIIKELGIEDNIIMINNHITRNELLTLFNSIDCYISLHRGEGLGLGMLEAMTLGKPVIASRYGGNLEFMNDENSLLVDCKIVEAKDDHPYYKHLKTWADPDINQAEELMLKIYNDREFGKKIGQKASDYVLKLYNNDDFKRDFLDLIK